MNEKKVGDRHELTAVFDRCLESGLMCAEFLPHSGKDPLGSEPENHPGKESDDDPQNDPYQISPTLYAQSFLRRVFSCGCELDPLTSS